MSKVAVSEAQKFVKEFALKNGWKDDPNIDKFDHLHEELVEMSKLLRYQSKAQQKVTIKKEKEQFIDGIGDLFFGLCRLANQLDVDIEEAFTTVKKRITAKYKSGMPEAKPRK